MAESLPGNFIERRCYPCQVQPQDWRLDPQGNFYELDLKMCQLKTLEYDFEWGQER